MGRNSQTPKFFDTFLGDAEDISILRQTLAFLRGTKKECPQAVRRLIPIGSAQSPDYRLRLTARIRSAARADDLPLLDSIMTGLPYKAVAATAGLSLRHLFRKRDALLTRIANSLQQRTFSINAVERSDDAHVRLEIASQLHARGFPNRTESLLNELLGAGVEPSIRCLALTARARAQFDQRNEAAASADLRAAKLVGDSSSSASLVSDALFSESFIEYRHGHLPASLQLAEHAAELLRSSYHHHNRFLLRQKLSRLHFLAILHQEGGSCTRSVDIFLKARKLLYSVSDPPRRELCENLALCAISRVSLPGQLAGAWHESREAIQLAHWHGLDREQVWSHIAFAMVANAAGRHAQSIAAYRTALMLARECLSGDELSRIVSINSRAETDRGNVDRAFALLPELRRLRPELGPFMSGITLLCEARIQEAARDGSSAKKTSTEAIKKLESLCQTHYIGLAYATRAATVRGSMAADDINVAVSYLRTGAPTYDLARALDFSAALTGNEKHRREAAELRAAAVI